MPTDPHDDLAQALKQLTPVPITLNKDHLLFEAGRRSVRQPTPYLSLVSLLLGLSSVGLLLLHQPEVRREVVYLPREADRVEPVPPKEQPATLNSFESSLTYYSMQQTLLEDGRPLSRQAGQLDTLPSPIMSAGSYLNKTWVP